MTTQCPPTLLVSPPSVQVGERKGKEKFTCEEKLLSKIRNSPFGPTAPIVLAKGPRRLCGPLSGLEWLPRGC